MIPLSVAVSSSPVFSPSTASLFKAATQPPRENLSLTLSLLKQSHSSSSSSSSSSPSCSPSPSSPSSSSSPSSFRIRVQKRPPIASAATLLKRKRPAQLDIPSAATLGFGGSPADAAVVEEEGVAEIEGFGYSVYCKRGKRIAMEDRFSALVDLQSDSKQALFGVFDGHGGVKAAEFAARNLDKNILDEVVTTTSEGEQEEVVDAVKRGYLKTDAQFLKEDLCGGSCCVTAIIRNGNLVVSNVGDCRAVLSRGGVADALTSDHRPSREDEKDRIETLVRNLSL